MKKLILILGIVLSMNAYCQKSRGVYFVVDFGPSLSIPSRSSYTGPGPDSVNTITAGSITKYKADLGCYLDLLVRIEFRDVFSLTTGVGYLFNIYRKDYKAGYEERKGNITHSDLYVPLLVNANIIRQFPLMFSIGPYVSYKISSRESGTKTIDTAQLTGIGSNGQPLHGYYLGVEPEQKYNDNVSDQYDKVDYGLTGQVTLDCMIKANLGGKGLKCVFFTRFNLGLSDTFKQKNGYKWHDHNWQLGMGFKF
jgi:hypothetical protein